MKLLKLIAILFCILWFVDTSYGHGDLHERILEVTDEIETTPDSSYLYFKRGKLYFEHKEFDNAIDDIDMANDLGFEDIQCDLILAKSYKSILNYREALAYLDKVDRKSPNHVIALKERARIYFDQQKYEESAINFEKVIEHVIKRAPQNYLDAQKSWIKLNSYYGDQKATEIITKGIADLGELFSLLHEHQKFYIAKSDYKNALIIQEKLIKTSNRKEQAYFDAAKYCRYSGDRQKRRYYLEKSLDAIYQLPPRKQQFKAMRDLKMEIERALKADEPETTDCKH